MQRRLEHVHAAVDLARLLALGEVGAVAGRREEAADAGAGGADALGQVALRDELELALQPTELSVRHGELVAVMAENRRAFLSFLERRIRHRESAQWFFDHFGVGDVDTATQPVRGLVVPHARARRSTRR